MTSKQYLLKELLQSVYGFSKVEFEGSQSGCTSVTGHLRLWTPKLMWEAPFKYPPIQDYTVNISIWLDKLKDGTYSLKFKTYHTHIHPSRVENVLRNVHSVESWSKYILGADVYERCMGYHYEKDIPTLRIHLKSLPWK